MVIKHCVGAVLYDVQGRVFLMQSAGKFKEPTTGECYWLLYGGRIEQGESEEAALRREAKEELSIEIADLVKIDENYPYDPQGIFYKLDITFLFETYAARMLSTDILPNHEIKDHRLFYRRELDNLIILPSTKRALDIFYADQRFDGLWK